MELTIRYLYPFDLGIELDPALAKKRYAREVLRLANAGEVLFEGEQIGTAELVSYIYPFGVAIIEIILGVKGDLPLASRLAVGADKTLIGRYPIPHFCALQTERVMVRASAFTRASKNGKNKSAWLHSAAKETSSDLFTIVTSNSSIKADADSFLRRNEKTLLGIVTGEPSYARLSEYALEKESLHNIGYYEDEIILMRRYGAFILSKEQNTFKDLIALALAQYFNLKSANQVLARAMERAQAVLEEQPPFFHFWKIPASYQRLCSEQAEFAKAKIALVNGLHIAHQQIPEIDSDWHLKSVHREIMSVFDIEDQTKIAMTRLETVDSIFGHLGEQMSTAFFIFLDFVFLTWLAVDLAGWIILIAKMK